MKSVTHLIRRIFFHPFGYDLVPLVKEKWVAPRKAPALIRAGEENLDVYAAWFGKEAVKERRFYNVGAEEAFDHPAWTKINYASNHYGDDYMDIVWDLIAGGHLPIESGKAKVVFTRYTLEHVPDAAVHHFFQETYRVLAKGGFLRVIVPDIEIYYAAYRLRDDAFFYRPKHDHKVFPNEDFVSNINLASFEQQFLWNFASNASMLHPDKGNLPKISDDELREILRERKLDDALDYCTARCSIDIQRRHPENHINWFHSEKLLRMLRAAGFTNTYRSGYGQSHCAVLRDTQLLEAREPQVGLFVEAEK